MLWILLGFACLLVLGIVLIVKYDLSMAGPVLILVAGFVLLCLIALGMNNYYDDISRIQQYNSLKMTIEESRLNGDEIERAALVQKIAETNEWIAKEQYWNETIFDDFIPDEVMELEYLK